MLSNWRLRNKCYLTWNKKWKAFFLRETSNSSKPMRSTRYAIVAHIHTLISTTSHLFCFTRFTLTWSTNLTSSRKTGDICTTQSWRSWLSHPSRIEPIGTVARHTMWCRLSQSNWKLFQDQVAQILMNTKCANKFHNICMSWIEFRQQPWDLEYQFNLNLCL